jgi:hypothetical protein
MKAGARASGQHSEIGRVPQARESLDRAQWSFDSDGGTMAFAALPFPNGLGTIAFRPWNLDRTDA